MEQRSLSVDQDPCAKPINGASDANVEAKPRPKLGRCISRDALLYRFSGASQKLSLSTNCRMRGVLTVPVMALEPFARLIWP